MAGVHVSESMKRRVGHLRNCIANAKSDLEHLESTYKNVVHIVHSDYSAMLALIENYKNTALAQLKAAKIKTEAALLEKLASKDVMYSFASKTHDECQTYLSTYKASPYGPYTTHIQLVGLQRIVRQGNALEERMLASTVPNVPELPVFDAHASISELFMYLVQEMTHSHFECIEVIEPIRDKSDKSDDVDQTGEEAFDFEIPLDIKYEIVLSSWFRASTHHSLHNCSLSTDITSIIRQNLCCSSSSGDTFGPGPASICISSDGKMASTFLKTPQSVFGSVSAVGGALYKWKVQITRNSNDCDSEGGVHVGIVDAAEDLAEMRRCHNWWWSTHHGYSYLSYNGALSHRHECHILCDTITIELDLNKYTYGTVRFAKNGTFYGFHKVNATKQYRLAICLMGGARNVRIVSSTCSTCA